MAPRVSECLPLKCHEESLVVSKIHALISVRITEGWFCFLVFHSIILKLLILNTISITSVLTLL